jgi:BMFP domain-containing protein YqiC
MVQKRIFDEISTRVGEVLAASPAKDIEKNLRVMLASAFSRLDLVTREDFDVQAKVLTRTREKLTALEARISELEKKLASEASGR